MVRQKCKEYLKLAEEFRALGAQIDAIACALTAVRLDPDSERAKRLLQSVAKSAAKPGPPPGDSDELKQLIDRKRWLDGALLKEVFLTMRPLEKWPVDPSAVVDRPAGADNEDLRRHVLGLVRWLETQTGERARWLQQFMSDLAARLNIGVDPAADAGAAEATGAEDDRREFLSLQHSIHNLGNECYKIGRFDDAIECYNAALRLEPDLVETYFNRSLARTRKQEYARAITDLNKVIELDPRLPEAYYTRGLVWEYQCLYDKAIDDYHEALRIDPAYEKASSQLKIAEEKKKNSSSRSGSESSCADKEGRILDFSFCLTRPDSSFSLAGGCGRAKRLLRKVVYYLQGNAAIGDWGAEPPRGVLLTGPPGVGKTNLVRSLAGEAGCPCYAPPSTIFQDMWAGNTEKNIRTLWDQASSHEKAIIVIDEFDGLACRRTDTRTSSGEAYYNRVVVTLLDLLDGLRERHGRLVVIGTTNRPDNIDRAFLRPGRFDFLVRVELPNVRDLAEIWLIQLGIAEKRALRREFITPPLREAVHADREAWLDQAFQRGTADASGVVRLARRAEAKGLTGADVREIVRRTVDGRVMAAIECSLDLGPICSKDLEQELEEYERPDAGYED